MRIKDLYIDAFGHFSDRSFEGLPRDIVLFYGKNEAGKSTLFNLLKAMIYGFYPRSDYPYRPWHVARYPEFTAHAVMEDGEEASIHRKLTRSGASGTFKTNEDGREISNRDLPLASRVSMKLYESLYALTQENKRELEQGTRQEIDERLLGRMGSDILRPTGKVIEELEEKISGLWRPDRRGNPADKRLKKQLAEADKAKKEAIENDKSVRDKAAELSVLEEAIDNCKAELCSVNAKIKKGEELIPLQRKLEQIACWRNKVPDIEAVRKLPEGLEAEYKRLSDLVNDAGEDLRKLNEEKKQLEKEVQKFTDEHRRLLSFAEAIENWSRKISVHEKEGRDIEELERSVQKGEAELERLSKGLLASGWDESHSSAFQSIVLPDLKKRIQDCEHHAQKVRDLESERSDFVDTFTISPISGAGILAAGITGIIVSCFGVWFSFPLLYGSGAALILLSLSGAGFNMYLSRQKEAAEKNRKAREAKVKESLEKAKTGRDRARAAVEDVLRGVPVAGAFLEKPDNDLYHTVEEMQKKLDELGEMKRKVSNRRIRWREERETLEELTSEFEEDASEGGVARLKKHLEEAVKSREESKKAKERIEEIDGEEYPEAEEKHAGAKRQLEALQAKVHEAVTDGLEFDEALSEARELQNTVRRIMDSEKELEENYPNLEELKAEIRELEDDRERMGPGWEELERARIRRAELNDKFADMKERKGVLESEVKNAGVRISAGEMEGKIESLKEEQERVRTERDRLALLANILKKADRDFRARHQPDVLKGASKYFSSLTENYRGVTIIEDEEGEERLAVVDNKGRHFKAEPPLSGGTLDQVYLSFRLAVVDHLDANQERLPLVLDEAMINWDDDRMRRGAEILSNAAENRQVFFFTCHDWIAGRISEIVGSEVIRL